MPHDPHRSSPSLQRSIARRGRGCSLASACASRTRRAGRGARARRRRRAPAARGSPRPPPAPRADAGGRQAPRPTRSSAATRSTAIALEHGLDYRELAAWNSIENPNLIRVGQVLRLAAARRTRGAAPEGAGAGVTTRRCARRRRSPSRVATAAPAPPRRPRRARNTDDAQGLAEGREGALLGGHGARDGARRRESEPALRESPRPRRRSRADRRTAPAPPPAPAPRPRPPTPPAPSAAARRPRLGAACRRRGPRLDVAGEGQGRHRLLRHREPEGHRHRRQGGRSRWSRARRARVVYAGSGLRGYGKLVIIKHNATFLSAYAHNREILVKEGQQVDARPEDRRDGQHRRRSGQAALRDPPARASRSIRSRYLPPASAPPPDRERVRERGSGRRAAAPVRAAPRPRVAASRPAPARSRGPAPAP